MFFKHFKSLILLNYFKKISHNAHYVKWARTELVMFLCCVNRNLSLYRKIQLPTVIDDRCVAPLAQD